MTTTLRDLADGVVAGDRRALARAITLVESTRNDHRAEASELLDTLLPHTGNSLRVGISGAPGVGKSTFIEAFGSDVVKRGHRVAVLAVDPSSQRSGGSILGDKTRMNELARHPNAYIRPSPSGGTLGGVARRTREAMLVCEAAGFDALIVETVGVGQSETEVEGMVDVFVLLVAPGGGDELQGIKRGVMELADIVVVNKADGDLLAYARQTGADYRAALHLMRPKHPGLMSDVVLCSSTTGDGLSDVWVAIERCHHHLLANHAVEEVRSEQAVAWFWQEVRERLFEGIRADPHLAAAAIRLERDVRASRISAPGAAEVLLASGPAQPGKPTP